MEDKSLLLAEIDARGRGFAHITVDLFDGVAGPESAPAAAKPVAGTAPAIPAAKLVARFEFEWFITKITK
jgi:hypothetical protein